MQVVSQTVPPQARPSIFAPLKTLGFYAVVYSVDVMIQILILAGIAIYTAGFANGPVPPSRLNEIMQAVVRSGPFFLFATCSSACLAAVAVWLFVRSRGETLFGYLGVKAPSAKDLSLGVLGGAVLFFFQIIVFQVFHLPNTTYWQTIFLSATLKPLFFVAMVIVGPLAEEMLYRGFLCQRLAESQLGEVGGVLISSALWAFVHFQYNYYERGWIFVMGCLLGAVKLRKGSITIPFLFHAAFNFAGFIFLLYS